MPTKGLRKKDSGKRTAIAINVVNPGSAPTTIPSTRPRAMTTNVSRLNARLRPWRKLSHTSDVPYPALCMPHERDTWFHRATGQIGGQHVKHPETRAGTPAAAG